MNKLYTLILMGIFFSISHNVNAQNSMFYDPLPDTTITRCESKGDTIFIYRFVKKRHVGCLVNGCQQEFDYYGDKLTYLFRKREMILISVVYYLDFLLIE